MPPSAPTVLGIETSCDETAAACVRGRREVLSSIVLSQIERHRPHGGVVPEIASRGHVEHLADVVLAALREARLTEREIDLVAATRGPGLASALLTGWTFAKGLALALGRPLCAVNHLAAHIQSAFLAPDAPEPREALPMVALVASGGHTALYRAETTGHYVLLGRTIDDAAGEALDKGAKLLGLGYPGGPAIEHCARGVARGDGVAFPEGRVRLQSANRGGLDPELCFSFSGLKTALRQRLPDGPPAAGQDVARLADAYEEAVVAALVARCARALDGDIRTLAAGGGVTLNARLRDRLRALCAARGVRLLLAPPRYCGDNAAMVAAAAAAGVGLQGPATAELDVAPNWALD